MLSPVGYAILFGERYYSYHHILSISDELLNLHRGQGLEILWRDSLQCPTEEEYVAMVSNSQ
jgi:hypothetical protein